MIFECHITCHIEDGRACERVAEELHWKTSEIARDPVLGQASYFYLTTHGKDYIKLWKRMREAVMGLEILGIMVVREKIELIMHDTKGLA